MLKNILFLITGFISGKLRKTKENTLYKVIKFNFDTNVCDKDDILFYVKDGCINQEQYMFITGEKYPEPQA